MAEQKDCPRCGETKSLDDFSIDRTRRDGHQPACKACNSAWYAARKPAIQAKQKAHRQANREDVRARDAARYADHRARIIALKLTLSCADCDWKPATEAETAQLDFDHVDPAKKHHSKSRGAFLYVWSWNRIEHELTLCEPRCKQCHRVRTGLQQRARNAARRARAA